MKNVSDAWSLLSTVFSHFILNMMCRKISLSILSNMRKCIIKSIIFCIGNVLNEFGTPEL